ncbi:hypothetical protein J6Y73_00795 [bacterium]|nr:hypothetical protein [bacterium]
MTKKDKTKIIITSILLAIMVVVALVSLITSIALFDVTSKEIEEAEEAIGLIFVIIVLLAPLIICAAGQFVPGIINIILFINLKKHTEVPKIKTYALIGEISSIVLTLFPIILSIITILLLQTQ